MKFCTQCGAKNEDNYNYCAGCGAPRYQENSGGTQQRAYGYDEVVQGMSKYYQREFKLIHDSNEHIKGSFNWAAFFFSGLWAIEKGLWLPVLVAIVLSVFTYGVAGIIYCFIFGFRGNWMLYNERIKNKQILC